MLRPICTFLLGFTLATLPLVGCSNSDAGRPEPQAKPAPASKPEANPEIDAAVDGQARSVPTPGVEPYQIELLDLAFDGMAKMPTNPHVKNRASGQFRVVEAAFDLDQPEVAVGYARRIDNWRKGHGLARYASELADQGRVEQAEQALSEALEIAQTAEGWRQERIRANVAAAYIRLGKLEEAAGLAMELSAAEAAAPQNALAEAASAEDYDKHLGTLKPLLADTSNFDQVRFALGATATLYDLFFDDEARREELYTLMSDSWGTTPMQVRIELCLRLAEIADRHEAEDIAHMHTHSAGQLLDAGTWIPRHYLPLASALLRVRHQVGLTDNEQAEVALLLRSYDDARDTIVNIHRADALAPLAAVCHAIGDEDQAMVLFARALDEAVVNPNSRPRADDLALICRIMATEGIEPDEALWAKLRTTQQELKAPW